MNISTVKLKFISCVLIKIHRFQYFRKLSQVYQYTLSAEGEYFKETIFLKTFKVGTKIGFIDKKKPFCFLTYQLLCSNECVKNSIERLTINY